MADGLLPYLFSRSNAFRRNLMDMVSNPADYAAKMGGQVVDTGNELAELQERSGMFGAGPVDEAARDELYQRAADAAMNMTGMIRMSHGSPHKFDKFDSSKIGTGEGAQAYGRGLYTAEGFNSPVAIGYKGSTSRFKYETPEGVKDAAGLINQLVKNAGDIPKGMDSSVRMKANEMVHDIIMGKSTDDVISAIRNSKFARAYSGLANALERIGAKNAQGYLYNIEAKWPSAAREARDPLGPQHFVAWEKPLKDQSPEIQNLAKQYGLTDPDHWGGDLVATMGAKRAEGAELMRQAGIPGIRYLDQNSRAAGQGTSNYVIFPGNESLLEIIQRTGAQ